MPSKDRVHVNLPKKLIKDIDAHKGDDCSRDRFVRTAVLKEINILRNQKQGND